MFNPDKQIDSVQWTKIQLYIFTRQGCLTESLIQSCIKPSMINCIIYITHKPKTENPNGDQIDHPYYAWGGGRLQGVSVTLASTLAIGDPIGDPHGGEGGVTIVGSRRMRTWIH